VADALIQIKPTPPVRRDVTRDFIFAAGIASGSKEPHGRQIIDPISFCPRGYAGD
jgi:hypothetical protein